MDARKRETRLTTANGMRVTVEGQRGVGDDHAVGVEEEAVIQMEISRGAMARHTLRSAARVGKESSSMYAE